MSVNYDNAHRGGPTGNPDQLDRRSEGNESPIPQPVCQTFEQKASNESTNPHDYLDDERGSDRETKRLTRVHQRDPLFRHSLDPMCSSYSKTVLERGQSLQGPE